MRVAEIIRHQINCIDPLAFVAWGTKLDMWKEQDRLIFTVRGAVKWNGRVSVILNSNDLYDVRFTRIQKLAIVEDVHVRDVFVEDLVDVINEKVG
jgi:hypothetical protein